MAREIDEKIVQMKFENSDFESGAQQTIKTLDNLNKATGSLGENTAGMDALISAVEKAGGKFSVLETIATGALFRIGSQAVDAGEKLVKSLTIDQVTAGWQKYDEKTRAVKTIMNATGESIDTVNDYLSKLMWYTDETSYNFVDMTSNIGKFTAQGIKLEDATTAMMGIANWAAQAGQGANEASRAMYNLSQSLGLGAVRLTDWMSIENANMATKEFKEMAIQTAEELGKLDPGKVTFQNFRETLKDNWFDSDVLIETLRKYGDYTEEVYKLVEEEGITASEAMERLADSYEGVGKKAFEAAQIAKTFRDALDATADAASSRWMTIFEKLFGNLEQQEKFWTDMSYYMYDAFVDGLDAVVEGLEEWESMGGSLELLGVLEETMDGLVGIIQVFGNAWEMAFGPITGDQILNITRAFQYFLMALTPTEEFLNNLSRGLSGVLTIFNVLVQYIIAVAKGFEPLLYAANYVLAAFGGLFGITGDLVSQFGRMAVQEAVLATITESVSSVVQTLLNGLGKVLQILGLIGFSFYEAFSQLTFSWEDGLSGMEAFVDTLKADFAEIWAFAGLPEISFEGIFGPISEFFSNLVDKVDGPIAYISEKLHAFFTYLSQIGQNGSIDWSSMSVGEKIITGLSKAIEFLVEGFEEVVRKGKSLSDFLKELLGPLGTGIKDFIEYVTSRISRLSLEDIFDIILTLNVARLVKPLSDLTESLAGLLDTLGASISQFQSTIKVNTFYTVAKAIGILAVSLFLLTTVPLPNLAAATTALTALGAALLGFMVVFDKIAGSWKKKKVEKVYKALTSLIPLAGVVLMLAAAVKMLGSLDIVSLTAATVAVGLLMAELLGFMKVMEMIKFANTGMTSLIAMAAAINLLVLPIKALGKLDIATLAKGLGAVGIAMLEMAAFAYIAGSAGAGVLAASVGMIALAAGLLALYPALLLYGGLDWTTLIDGLGKLAATLAIVILAMTGLSFAGGAGLAGAVGVIALAGALALLMPQLVFLSAFSWDSIGKMIGSFAAILGTFVIAGMALSPVAPVISGLAIAIAAVDLSIAAIILTLTGFIKVLPIALATFVAFANVSEDTIDQGVNNIELLLRGLLRTFIHLKSDLVTAVVTFFEGIVEGMVKVIPNIVNGVLLIIEEILHTLNERLPGILDELDELLEMLTPYIEKFAGKGVDMAVAWIRGLLTHLWENLKETAQEIYEWAKELADEAIQAFKDKIDDGKKKLEEAGKNFSIPFLDGIDIGLDRHSPPKTLIERAKDSLGAFTDTIKSGATKLGLSGEGFANSFSDKVKEKLEESMPDVATTTTQSFVNNIKKSNTGGKAAQTVATQIKEDKSPEEAAKEKAQAVADAFSTEFNKISSMMSGLTSKFSIAEAYLGPEDDEGKIAKKKEVLEMQKLQEELQWLADKYNLSWDQYFNILATPTSTNEDIQKAYSDYMKNYEDLASKALEIATKQKELYSQYEAADEIVMERMRELMATQATLIDSSKQDMSEATQEAYNNFLNATIEEEKQYYKSLYEQLRREDQAGIFSDLVFPIDKEAIRRDVYSELGLDSNNAGSLLSVEELIKNAVDASRQTYLTAVEETYPELVKSFESQLAGSADEVLDFVGMEVDPIMARMGIEMFDAVEVGMKSKTTDVSQTGKSISKESAEETKKTSEDWQEVGTGMMDGIIQGIEDRRAEVIEAAIEVALAALAAAKNALGIASPSKAFLAVGMYAIDGLRMGIENNKDSVTDATENVADDMVTPFDSINGRISHILDDSLHPVIDPTLDLTGVKRAAKSIDNLWSSSTLRTLGDISLSELSRRDEILSARTPVAPVVETTNNFTQNNYSPKALSDAEIYRQTKKEIDWAFKGAKR